MYIFQNFQLKTNMIIIKTKDLKIFFLKSNGNLHISNSGTKCQSRISKHRDIYKHYLITGTVLVPYRIVINQRWFSWWISSYLIIGISRVRGMCQICRTEFFFKLVNVHIWKKETTKETLKKQNAETTTLYSEYRTQSHRYSTKIK